MTREFQNLFGGIDLADGVEVSFKEDGKIAEITIYGFPLVAGYMEEQHMVMLHAYLCEIPRQEKDAANLFRFMLAANNQFSKTASCTLGLDEEAGLLTLQTVWLIHRLTPEGFINLIKNFVSQCAYWLENLPMESLKNVIRADESTDSAAYANFLRV